MRILPVPYRCPPGGSIIKKQFTLFIMLMVLFLSGAACEQKGPAGLVCHFRKGDTQTFRMTTEQKISQQVMDREQTMTQSITIEYVYFVEDLNPDQSARVKFTYRAISLKTGGEGGEMSYDSSRPGEESGPLHGCMSSLIGKGFTCTMSPQGKISDVKGLDTLMGGVWSTLNLPENQETEELKKQIKQNFGEEAVKESLEKLTFLYPDKPVRIGESWSKTAAVTQGFPMTMTTTWTLKERRNDAWIIDMRSIVEPNKEAPPLKLGPLTLGYSLSGSQKGSFSIDSRTGLNASGTILQDFRGTVRMSMEGLDTGPLSWPITIESRTTYETFLAPEKE